MSTNKKWFLVSIVIVWFLSWCIFFKNGICVLLPKYFPYLYKAHFPCVASPSPVLLVFGGSRISLSLGHHKNKTKQNHTHLEAETESFLSHQNCLFGLSLAEWRTSSDPLSGNWLLRPTRTAQKPSSHFLILPKELMFKSLKTITNDWLHWSSGFLLKSSLQWK